ncbi:hypothetical protein MIND_00957700 [Mycena indigotica]|uniref:Uncharacterized protein n=1 Tax=Mycena indigotica TaxID=2126181 RepID=A0A8H6SCY3_9AGAR|nr:uncharacterized protein MIND_00957700 [Mycena indigotica]KAF7297246.1 hypothetical protein MIND_00957700 [Mycena indigotica]
MIVPSGKSDETPSVPVEAPPAYEPSSSRPPPAEKASGSSVAPPPPPLSPSSPSSSAIKSRVVQKNTWAQLGDDVGGFMSDLGLGSAKQRAAQEVRKTVTKLIHDLVRNQTIDGNLSCAGILDSCSEACSSNGINMPNLLQQAYIEGHTPLYWAIVKRPADSSEAGRPMSEADLPPLVRSLLAYSAPLKPQTVADIQLACLHTCDNWLFQCLRGSPDFPALPHKDQLLLGTQIPPDTIAIQPSTKHNAPLTATFAFADFQKRMRVTHEVKLEFISHSRIWEFAFIHYESGAWGINAGQWAARLKLWDKSPQANIDAATITIDPQPAEEAEEPSDEEKPLTLEMSGKLYVGNELNSVLPDTFLYPHNPFLAADGTLRGKLIIQLKAQ